MCVVSMIGDDFAKKWPNHPNNPYQGYPYQGLIPSPLPEVTRQEFDALKKEMEELKKLLQAAKTYDEATGQKDCEMEDKIALIKKIAELVGVDMDAVFGEK